MAGLKYLVLLRIRHERRESCRRAKRGNFCRGDLVPEFECSSIQRRLPILRSAAAQYRSHQVSAMMGRLSLFYSLSSLFLVLPLSWALKFDLAAHTGHSNKYERCIRNFVAKDTLVLVTAIVDGQKGDGQMVNMHVSLPLKTDTGVGPL